MGQKRLFLGGLFPDVTEADLKSRFDKYGKIGSIEIKKKRDIDGSQKTFAYIDMEAEDRDYQKCFTLYNRSKWKGSELTLQFAKENFIARLQNEREAAIEEQNKDETEVVEIPVVVNRLNDIAGVHNFHMKGAAPGTAIPGEQEWIVGKYGRVLPVMHIKTRGSRKIVRIDPSKYTHNVKRITTDVDDTFDPSKLTWQLKVDEESEITKKRKGQFPDWKPKPRKVVKNVVHDKDSTRNVKDNSNNEDENKTVERSKHKEMNSRKVVAKQLDPSWFLSDSDSDIESYFKMRQNVFQNANAKTLETVQISEIHSSESDLDIVPVVEESTGRQPSGAQSSQIDLSRFDSDSDSEMTFGGKQPNAAVIPQRNSVMAMKVPCTETGLISQPDMSRFDSDSDDDVDFNIRSKSSNNMSSAFPAVSTSGTVSVTEKPVRSGNVSQKFTVTETGDKNRNENTHTRSENKTKDTPKQKGKKNDLKKNKGKWSLLEFKGTGSLSGTKEKECSVGTTSLTGPRCAVERSFPKSDESLENKLTAYINRVPNSSKGDLAQGGRTEGRNVGGVPDKCEKYSKDLVEADSDTEDSSESEAARSDAKSDDSSSVDSDDSSSVDTDDSSSVDFKQKPLVKDTAVNAVGSVIPEVIGSSDDEDDNDSDDTEDEETTEAKTSGSDENSSDSSSDGFKHKELMEGKAVGQIIHEVNDDDGDDDNDNDDDEEDDSSSSEEEENNHILRNVSNKCNSNVEADVDRQKLKKSEHGKTLNNAHVAKPISVMDASDDDSSSEEASEADDSSSDRDESSSESDTDGKPSEVTTNHEEDSMDETTSDMEDSESDTDGAVAGKPSEVINHQEDSTDESTSTSDMEEGESDTDDVVAGKPSEVTTNHEEDCTDESTSDMEEDESDTDCAVAGKPSAVTTNHQEDSTDETTSDMEDSDFESLVAKEMEKVDSVKKHSSATGKSHTSVTKANVQHVKKGKDMQNTHVNTCKDKDDGHDKSILEQKRRKSEKIADVKQLSTLNEHRNTNKLPSKQSSTLNEQGKIHILPSNHSVSSETTDKVAVSPVSMDKVAVSRMSTDKVAVELKRQQAVQKWHKGHLAQVSVIQKALSNLDGAAPSRNKITFDSDSEQEVAQLSGGVSVSTAAAPAQPRMGATQPETRKRSKALFDSASDDSEPEDDALFNIQPQFEGASGSKLMKLQSRFSNDERFKLDSRFAESGSEDEGLKTVPEEDERTRSLKMLQSVVGAKVNLHLGKKKTFKDMSKLTYDPSKEDHSHHEIKTNPKAKIPRKQDKKKTPEAEEDDVVAAVVPEVGKERFFQVSQSIKDTFAKAAVEPEEMSSQGFSLLAAFGHDDDVEEEQRERSGFPVSAAIPISESTQRDRMSLDDRFRVDDDDSSDDEREGDEQMEEEDRLKKDDKEASKKSSGVPVETAKKATSFFFMQNDDRLKEGEKFYRTQDLQTVTDKWLEQRQQYKQRYKQKHKNLCRKLRTNQPSQHARNQRGGRGGGRGRGRHTRGAR